MIIRVTLFISLVVFFYAYCSDDTTVNKYREPNDINMLKVPADISPIQEFDSSYEASNSADSSLYFIARNFYMNNFPL